jgi:hypothetical protein
MSCLHPFSFIQGLLDGIDSPGGGAAGKKASRDGDTDDEIASFLDDIGQYMIDISAK